MTPRIFSIAATSSASSLPLAALGRRRGRRGSILIMVVAVLVLLAIMGTAFISTTRIDRQNATINEGGPPGIATLAKDAIVGDLFGTGGAYRAPNDNVPNSPTYEHFDAPGMDPITGESRDKFLAARLPELLDIDLDNNAGTIEVENAPAWRFASDVGQAFEDVEEGVTLFFDVGQRYAFLPTSMSFAYATDEQPKEYPAFRVVRYDPVMQMWRGVVFDPTAVLPNPRWPYAAAATWNDKKYLAGDADGDGIADSLLFRIPGPPINGKTYFGALRIIDNGSAVNVNTAWSNLREFGQPTGAFPYGEPWDAFGNPIAVGAPATLGFFPSHIGLQQLLYDLNATTDRSAQMEALTPSRFAELNYADILPITGPAPESASSRTDFEYTTQGEAFYNQSIRRSLNTSYNGSVSAATKFALLDEKANTASLAYRFTLINPKENTDPQGAGNYTGGPLPYPAAATKYPYPAAPAEVEKYLGPSAYITALNHVGDDATNVFTIYPANGVANWYDWNFNTAAVPVFNEFDLSPATYDTYPSAYQGSTPPLVRPIRPYLTMSNPVSNYVSSANPTAVPHTSMLPYTRPLPHGAGPYTAGSFVTEINPDGVAVVYRYLETAPGNEVPTDFTLDSTTTPPTPTAPSLVWARESWTEAPAKTSLNTAGFGELFRSFWQVMGGPSVGTGPFDSYVNDRWTVTPAIERLNYSSAIASAATTPGTLNDPYIGNKFDPATFLPDTTQQPGYPPEMPSWQHPARMFRSSLRALPLAVAPGGFDNTTPRFNSQIQMYLRAALSAVNAEDLRDSDDNITFRDVPLAFTSEVGGTVTQTPVTARVYGNERQPYITEVYVQTDIVSNPATVGNNPAGYVAIELYNPHDVAIDISNCRIAAVTRSNSTSYSGTPAALVTMADIVPDLTTAISSAPLVYGATGVIIPPKGYVVLENYNPAAAGNDARYRPAATGLPATGAPIAAIVPPAADAKNYVYVSGLEAFIGATPIASREIVLLRGRDALNVPSTITGVPPGSRMVRYGVVAVTELSDNLVPLDQFDFTGLPPGAPASATAWHYARESATAGRSWRFVYPGRYNAGTAFADATLPLPSPRHQGVSVALPWDPNTATDPWHPTTGAAPVPPLTLTDVPPVFGVTSTASYPVTFAIPLLSNEAAAMQALRAPASGANQFPFGGFARVGDALNVPFIGAYRIDPVATASPNTFYELNSITMDAAMAEDTDTATDSIATAPVVPAWTAGTNYRAGDRVLHTGTRLVALANHTATAANEPAINTVAPTTAPFWQIDSGPLNVLDESVGRFVPVVIGPRTDLAASLDGAAMRYGWASDILDYFTAIQNPQDDYLPNVLPRNYQYVDPTTDELVYFPNSPEPIASEKATLLGEVNRPEEVDAPIEGLINVNTAPYDVLRRLPWTDNPIFNNGIARSIVDYRNTHGYSPFRNIYDLARVPYLATVNTIADVWLPSRPVVQSTNEALPVDGDLTASPTLGDNLLNDYKEKLLTLIRVSNLITTRSDSFTVYGLVQGWENPGTPTPYMARQERVAFTADRSAVTPGNRELKVIDIPVE